jgi:GH43 family beta-xylosidase
MKHLLVVFGMLVGSSALAANLSGDKPNAGSAREAASPRRLFVNPIAEGADPWITQHEGKYIVCLSEANRGIALHISDRLTALGPKRVVWTAPQQTMTSAEIWAPELHFLDGRWHVYYAGSDGHNRNHRMWVLRSADADPLGTYSLHGPLYTGDHPETGADNRWAIDGTVLELAKRRYFIWSGWEDERDEQWLYIAPMKDPLTVAAKRVRLCRNNDYLWERVDEKLTGRGLHEAPQVLQREGRTFIVYSCSGSWQTSYKLGLLELRSAGDPLKPEDWVKHSTPVFHPTAETFGVGHGSFVKSPDGREDWMVYHAKLDRANGWRRGIFAQPFQWTPAGLPNFGSPVAAEALPLASGEVIKRTSAPQQWDFKQTSDLTAFQYFGHHQLIDVVAGRLQLGRVPKAGVNVFRAGEKIVATDGSWSDFTAAVRVKVEAGERDAGILFRCTLPALGYDAQHSYFASIIPQSGKVVLGSMDGKNWRELAAAEAGIRTGQDYELSVTTKGAEIIVHLDGREVIRKRDTQFTTGSVGLRVVDTQAIFSNLRVQ